MLTKKVLNDIIGYRIQVTDRTKKREYNLSDIFSINQDNLIEEFSQQSSVYAYFASLQVQADINSDVIKLGLEQERAAADSQARGDMEKDGKKYTEAVIRGIVDLDDECSKLAGSHIDSEYDAKLLKAICNALEMRANMLVAIGSQLRHEMGMIDLHNREKSMDRAVKDLDDVLAKKKVK